MESLKTMLTKPIFKAFAGLADSLCTLNFYLDLFCPNQDENKVIFFTLGALERKYLLY